MSFKAKVYLLIFCLDDLSIDVNGVLNFPTTIVLLSDSPCMPVNICFINLVAPWLRANIFMNVIFSSWIVFFIII